MTLLVYLSYSKSWDIISRKYCLTITTIARFIKMSIFSQNDANVYEELRSIENHGKSYCNLKRYSKSGKSYSAAQIHLLRLKDPFEYVHFNSNPLSRRQREFP